jgi:cytidine deaminase
LRLGASQNRPVSDARPQLTPTAKLSPDDKARLLAAARGMLDRAYAPYSNFHVGAALLTESGAIYTGCNVENASYGLTICAERAAICAAVAAEGQGMRLRGLVVLNGNNAPCSPCGACRQVIFEFGPEATIIYQGRDALAESTAGSLLPAGFSL